MSAEASQESPGSGAPGRGAPLRVFISYAHDDAAHVERVRDFWLFLRRCGIDAIVDLPAADERQDWAQWMTRQVRDADRVLVIASLEYKRRAEGDAGPGEGRGVQWEARLIRDRFYADQQNGLQLVLPVVLPGGAADDLPLWLAPASATWYQVADYTPGGAEDLLRVLTAQPREIVLALGPVPVFPPRGGSPAPAARPALRTEVLIEARDAGSGQVTATAWLAGTRVGQRQAVVPVEVQAVWSALRLPPLAAAGRMADAGRRLAGLLFDEQTQALLAGVVRRLPPGDVVEIVLAASGTLLSLPVELLRLSGDGGEVGPLGLRAGVSICRRPAASGGGAGPAQPPAAAAGLPGPLKILAAVAAPDETRTRNPHYRSRPYAALAAPASGSGRGRCGIRRTARARQAPVRSRQQRGRDPADMERAGRPPIAGPARPVPDPRL